MASRYVTVWSCRYTQGRNDKFGCHLLLTLELQLIGQAFICLKKMADMAKPTLTKSAFVRHIVSM